MKFCLRWEGGTDAKEGVQRGWFEEARQGRVPSFSDSAQWPGYSISSHGIKISRTVAPHQGEFAQIGSYTDRYKYSTTINQSTNNQEVWFSPEDFLQTFLRLSQKDSPQISLAEPRYQVSPDIRGRPFCVNSLTKQNYANFTVWGIVLRWILILVEIFMIFSNLNLILIKFKIYVLHSNNSPDIPNHIVNGSIKQKRVIQNFVTINHRTDVFSTI